MSRNGAKHAAAKPRGVPSSDVRAHIMVATPTYTGDLNAQYVQSLFAALVHCLSKRIQLELRTVSGASLIQYARNQLVREFLEDPAFTHILWIDADVGFDPRAIARLVEHGKDVVGGVYPMKCQPVEWPYEPAPGEQSTKLHRAKIMPGGFLLCSRAAVQAVADQATTYMHHMAGLKYPTKHVFDLVLRDGVLLGEDVIFAQRLALAGYELWVDPDLAFSHHGQFSWRGNLATAIEQGTMGLPPLDSAMLLRLATAGPDELAEPISALHRAWGNAWSMPPAELVACALLAKRSKMILEAGSGLSTLVMAAANPAAKIHTLEENAEWMQRLLGECRRNGLNNVTIHLTPIAAPDWCYAEPADLPAGPFDLAVVDGPVFLDGTELAHSTDTRRAFYTRYADRIRDAVLMIDDVEFYGDIADRYQHERIGGRFAICLPKPKMVTSSAA